MCGAYCVTFEGKVYGFGENICQLLDFNKNIDNKSYVLIQQLCHKNIEEFFGNERVFFARSETNVIYCWGWNYCARLGRGFKCDDFHKSAKNELLSDKNLRQISCGFRQCFALSLTHERKGKPILMSEYTV